jgi:DNA-directed RNA polymerase specialized sigma24 family protein
MLMDRLPENQQEAIRLIFFEDLTLKETAERMDLSVSGVKYIKKSAITKMAEVIHPTSLAEVLTLFTPLVCILLQSGVC